MRMIADPHHEAHRQSHIDFMEHMGRLKETLGEPAGSLNIVASLKS